VIAEIGCNVKRVRPGVTTYLPIPKSRDRFRLISIIKYGTIMSLNLSNYGLCKQEVRAMNRRPLAVFLFLWTSILLLATLVTPGAATGVGDTLTVIQRPLLNIPTIVTVGDTMTIECEEDPGTSGWAAELIKDDLVVPLSVLGSTYDASTLWWEIEVLVPAVSVYELYDLVVTADGGIEDTTWNAVRVIPELKDDYYFVHITDSHLVTHLYYYESGADTDTSEIDDLREVINDINIINPEFVLFTGDIINEGELEEFLDKRYYTRTQALLTEFEVPVYLASGNHDIGGWDDSPPPDGNARRNWWRFFGWKRCDSPPPGAPWYTQNYSFHYGPVHYIGLEAYINYDGWRYGTYGGKSFTSGQMQWLGDEIDANPGSAAHVLFYHRDFSNQINLNSLGADMALWGHTHRNDDDFSHPHDIGTDNTCDGARAYRLIRVSGGTLQPTYTVDAGSDGSNLEVDFFPGNDGTYYSVRADITNDLSERFEHGLIRVLMPNEPGTLNVTGGTLLQTDDSGPYTTCYVGVDILESSTKTVTVQLDTTDTEDPVVTIAAPNGGETWDIGASHDITWTATDNVGVTSIELLLSTDGGGTYPHTIASGETNDGSYSWLVDVVPTTQARVKVIAYDAAANSGEDASDADFEVNDPTAGAGAGLGVPSRPVISGNLPNPFGARTVVRFGIPGEGHVDLALYDVSGRSVAKIASGTYPAGYHEVTWENDGSAGTGLYFLRLGFGPQEVTRKLVVAE
jgi:3',5'-cyclic AMP phosphodiesterase CpdA